jgi:hypothetical protein
VEMVVKRKFSMHLPLFKPQPTSHLLKNVVAADIHSHTKLRFFNLNIQCILYICDVPGLINFFPQKWPSRGFSQSLQANSMILAYKCLSSTSLPIHYSLSLWHFKKVSALMKPSHHQHVYDKCITEFCPEPDLSTSYLHS